jgi:hypothetical protein
VFLKNSRVPVILYNYRIIFLLKKAWNMSTVQWTESMAPVHGVHGISLNEDRPSGNLWLGLNEPKGYPAPLILAVGFDLDGVGVSSPSVRIGQDRAPGGVVAASLRELKLALWDTILRSDSSNAIYAMRGTCFADLPRWKWTTGSWQ